MTGNLLRDTHALTGLESLKGGKHGRSVGKETSIGEGPNPLEMCSYAPGVRYVPPSRWPLAVAGYTLAGLAPAVLDTPVRSVLVHFQLPPVGATIILVNFMIPLLFVTTAVVYPRPLFAILGVPLALVAYTTERLFELNPAFWQWSAGMFVSRLHPIVTVGTIFSGAIALSTCLASMPRRKVGVAPPPNSCHNCGYDLGYEIFQCPECGEVRIRNRD